MKGVIAAICIAAVIVFGSIAYTHQMRKISDELLEINNSVTQKISEENYADASEEIKRLIAYLDDKRSFLAATGNHDRLDTIETDIKELKGYVDGEQKTDSLSRCSALGVLLEHLPRDYELRLDNIL